MYCRNCGTVVPGNEELCEACRMEQLIQKSQAPKLDMSRESRGAAIVSIILGSIGLLLSIIVYAVMLSVGGGGLLLFVFACGLVCTVFSIINGVRGISAFKRAGRMNAIRPVASLVCGIIGLNIACVSGIYWLLAFMVSVVLQSGI